LGQTWWAPLAALLVVGQLVIAVAFGFELDDDTESGIAGIVIALVGAALAFWLRTAVTEKYSSSLAAVR
jgi:hypothetical protein